MQQADWVSFRSGVFDALGLISYVALAAFFESFFLFSFLVLLGLCISPNWDPQKKMTLLGIYFWLGVIASGLNKVYFKIDQSIGTFAFRVFYNLNRFGEITLPLLVIAILCIVVGIVILVSRFEKLSRIFYAIMDRVTLLAVIYLSIDLIALIVIVIRNI
jgi:hypothetical protein